MNVEEYEVIDLVEQQMVRMKAQVDSASNLEGSRKELRSSDPELETIPYRCRITPYLNALPHLNSPAYRCHLTLSFHL